MRAQAQKYNLNSLYPTPGAGLPVPVDVNTRPRKSAHDTVAGSPRLDAAMTSLRALLTGVGAVAGVAYVAAMPHLLQFAGVGIFGATWYALYDLLARRKNR